MNQPTTGRTVLYRLSADDVARTNQRRKDSAATAGVSSAPYTLERERALHVGNTPAVGDVVPLVIVRVWQDEFGPGVPGVNGQALLDGNDVAWVTSAREGTEPGMWHWPVRT